MNLNKPVVTLNLFPLEFAAIYALLMQVRLGERNEFEKAISSMMIDLEKNGINEWVENFFNITGLTLPDLKIEASNEEGVVLNLV